MYNYRENIKEDIKDYIREHYDSLDDINESQLYDDLFCEDSVTGNANGSYTFNSYEAHENLFGNEHLLQEALEEFCCDDSVISIHLTDYEWQDVTIRCYLLRECIGEALLEMEGDGEFEDEEL